METVIEKENVRLEINQDIHPDNPRDIYDNISTMVCFHRHYNLGDKHDYNRNDYNNWDEMEKDIIRNEKPICIKPLYLYDHSGLTISTSPFGCRWDSGQIGFVFVRKDDIKREFGKKRITKELREKSERLLQCEVNDYDEYLTGNIYQVELYENDESIECCGNFIGDDFWKNGMSDLIPDSIIQKLYDDLVKVFGEKP